MIYRDYFYNSQPVLLDAYLPIDAEYYTISAYCPDAEFREVFNNKE